MVRGNEQCPIHFCSGTKLLDQVREPAFVSASFLLSLSHESSMLTLSRDHLHQGVLCSSVGSFVTCGLPRPRELQVAVN